ncbi:MAG: branched-chain amino acid ABC transporter permease [Lawsonibacter sp.]
MNAYYMGLVANLGINILGALSVYIILRSGQISVGNAGFMAVGAYGSAILSSRLGVPIAVAVLVGGILAALTGMLVGVPALRLKGTYLVIGTITFTAMIRSLAQIMTITGGAAGFRGIVHMQVPEIFFFVGLAVILLYLFERTRLGLSMRAVSADEQAAGAAGVNVVAMKILSFTIGAGLAGIGGGCYAHWVQYVEPGDFSTMMSTMMVLPVILGGRNRILGAVVGAGVFTLLPELLRFASTWRMVVYGILVILIVIYRPDGLITYRSKGKHVQGTK